jgi:hypothetical protein
LRTAWLQPVSEQISSCEKSSTSVENTRRSTSLSTNNQSNRRFIRPSVPLTKMSKKNDIVIEKITDEQSLPIDNYSHQKFLDWRSYLMNNNNQSQFQLYILPVRV